MHLAYGRIAHLDMFSISKPVLATLIRDTNSSVLKNHGLNYKRKNSVDTKIKRLCFVFGFFFVVAYFSENVHRYDKRNLVISVKLFAVVKQMLTYVKKDKSS